MPPLLKFLRKSRDVKGSISGGCPHESRKIGFTVIDAKMRETMACNHELAEALFRTLESLIKI